MSSLITALQTLAISALPTAWLAPATPPSLIALLTQLAAKYPLTPASPADTIILMTDDSTPIPTSRALLAAHSQVFSAASTLTPPSHPSSIPPEPESVSLSSTTTAGLNLVLAVITILGLYPDPTAYPHRRIDHLRAEVRRYMPSLSPADLRAIGEAIDCARAYEINTFLREFVWGILSPAHNQDSPPVRRWVLYLLAARRAEHSGGHAASMLRAGLTVIPPPLVTVLQQFAPDHIGKYAQLVARYDAAHVQLLRDMRYTEPLTDRGINDYAVGCQGGQLDRYHPRTQRGYRLPCHAWQSQCSWSLLRQAAASNVHAQVRKDGTGPSDYAAILPMVAWTVPCTKCATRLARTFELAVRRFRRVAGSY